MPHGAALTPLGRQLRSVLASLRHTAAVSAPRARAVTVSSFHTGRQPLRTSDNTAGSPFERLVELQHETTRTPIERTRNHTYKPPSPPIEGTQELQHGDKAVEERENESSKLDAYSYRKESTGNQSISDRRRIKKQKRRRYVLEALSATGKTSLVPRIHHNKVDLSYTNPRDVSFRQKCRDRESRHLLDHMPDINQQTNLTLELIVSRCIIRGGAHNLETSDVSFVQQEGYDLADIQAWADIVSTKDSGEAASLLARWMNRSDRPPIPIFVIQTVLRRPEETISLRAFRILLSQIHRYVENDIENPVEKLDSVFLLFMRLTRHARLQLPQALPVITIMLLDFVTRADESKSLNDKSTWMLRLAHMLNKSMKLIAIPTSIEPYKDTEYQISALSQVLQYMAEHDPPLLVNREGYRAVIRVQLAQGKTEGERRWASLKALSWPPWKEDQTNLDAQLTPEHGISRAGATIIQMQQAGYQLTPWEQAAKLLAGWDIDGTPSVQTRSWRMLRSHPPYNDSNIWAARIVSTRTMQEAWAAFLAYVDSQRPLSPPVILAVMEKLRQEESREHQRKKEEPTDLESFNAESGTANARSSINGRPSLPGDAREISPLPPSTHLHTYTRVPFPQMNNFIEWLLTAGYKFDAGTLAFATSKSISLARSFHIMRTAESRWPAIDDLLHMNPKTEHARLPNIIFTGFIEALCRWPHLNLRAFKIHPDAYDWIPKSAAGMLYSHNPLVRAITLLKQRRSAPRLAWSHLLRALATKTQWDAFTILGDFRNVARRPNSSTNALAAQTLMEVALAEMRRFNRELDIVELSLCGTISTRTTIGSYELLWRSVFGESQHALELRNQYMLGQSPERLLRDADHLAPLKEAFNDLVGEQVFKRAYEPGTEPLIEPVAADVISHGLLFVPNSALLHNYIRSLGTARAYADLADLIRWMAKHSTELAKQRSRDRSSEAMLRRAITATRVFLERSWLKGQKPVNEIFNIRGEQTADESRKIALLEQFEKPAPAELVAEMRDLVESVENWPSWPTDDEVNDYCNAENFTSMLELREQYK